VAALYQKAHMASSQGVELKGTDGSVHVLKKYCPKKSIESAADSLSSLLGEAISQGNFSYSGRKRCYQRFQETEIAFIEETRRLTDEQA
jgi:hypothetical protein